MNFFFSFAASWPRVLCQTQQRGRMGSKGGTMDLLQILLAWRNRVTSQGEASTINRSGWVSSDEWKEWMMNEFVTMKQERHIILFVPLISPLPPPYALLVVLLFSLVSRFSPLSYIFSAVDFTFTPTKITYAVKWRGADGVRRRYIFRLFVKRRPFHLIRWFLVSRDGCLSASIAVLVLGVDEWRQTKRKLRT